MSLDTPEGLPSESIRFRLSVFRRMKFLKKNPSILTKVCFLLCLTIISVGVVSCGSVGNEYFSYTLGENEELIPSMSKVEYFNGRLNFVISSSSNNSLFLNINGRLFKLGNSSLERVVLSSMTNNYVVIFVSNNQRFMIYRSKTFRIDASEEVFLGKDNLVLINKYGYSSSSSGKGNEIPDFNIQYKEDGKYIVLDTGQTFGPFLDVELPYLYTDRTNWWIVAKEKNGLYVLIVNGRIVSDKLQSVGIPSFSGKGFVVNVRKDDKHFLLSNFGELYLPFEEVMSPIVNGKNWFLLVRSSNTYFLVGGSLDVLKRYRIFYSSTNNISYPVFDKYGNVWIVEEGSSKYIIKNFRVSFGPYEDTYYLQMSSGDALFAYKNEGSWFVRFRDKNFGPFEFINEILYFEGSLVINFSSNAQNYIFHQNEVLGPFNEIIALTKREGRLIVLNYSNGYYVVIQGQVTLGPYDEVFWNNFSYKNGRFLFSFKSNNMVYINYSSKVYGPFVNVYMPILSDDGKTWGAGVMNENHRFSLVLNGEVVDEYLSVDYESVRFDTKKATWGGVTEKNDGFFVTTSYGEFGPFDKVIQVKFSNDLSKVKFISKIKDKFYAFFVSNGKVFRRLGPYDMAVFINEDFENDLLVVKDGKRFVVYSSVYSNRSYAHLKEIGYFGRRNYVIHRRNGKDVLEVDGKTAIEMDRIVRVMNSEGSSLSVLGINRYGMLVRFSGGITNTNSVFVRKEEMLNDTRFFWVYKNNEWEYLIFDGLEIGPFSSIDRDSFRYEPKTKSYGFVATRDKKKFIVSSAGSFGPFESVLKFFVLNGKVLYLVEDKGVRGLWVNDRRVCEGIIDFDIRYDGKELSFIRQDGRSVSVRTMRVEDLLNR